MNTCITSEAMHCFILLYLVIYSDDFLVYCFAANTNVPTFKHHVQLNLLDKNGYTESHLWATFAKTI